jgi:hypothetical protein
MNLFKETEKEVDINKEIKRLLTNITIGSVREANGPSVNFCHYFISPENKNLNNSEYFYKEKPNFLHFTSLIALESIITNGHVRLYNLHNLNDPREFSFAGNLLTVSDSGRKEAKDNFFLLSMCKTETVTSKVSTQNEFNIWRLYGDAGKGVSIEFSFSQNPAIDWVDYHLSSVYYGSESKTKLKLIHSFIKKHENNAPLITLDFSSLACFHKSKLFGLESEVRLLFDFRKHKAVGATTHHDKEGKIFSPIVRLDISKSAFLDKEVKYLELPIFNSTSTPPFNSPKIPLPKIERIILGYQYKDNFIKVSEHFTQLCKEKLGYVPKIVSSRLTKYYHELS